MNEFTLIEELGEEYIYILDNNGDFSGFEFDEGQAKCKSLGSSLTDIKSNRELELILDFAFASAEDQGFLAGNENNVLATRIGLTRFTESGEFKFENGEDTSFFSDITSSPPWKDNVFVISDFPNDDEISAIFSINKNLVGAEANFFLFDAKDITYGIICKKDRDDTIIGLISIAGVSVCSALIIGTIILLGFCYKNLTRVQAQQHKLIKD